LTTFGKLRIVPDADLGGLAVAAPQAVLYDWNLYYSLPGIVLWGVIILLIISLKDNRVPSAVLIFVPILVLSLLWTSLKKLIPGFGSVGMLLDQVVASVIFGLAAVWLLAHKTGNRNRLAASVLGLTVMLLCWVVGAISYTGIEFSRDSLGSLIYFAFLSVSIVLGLTLAGRGCRKRYSGPRFALKLLLWTVVVSLAVIYAFFLSYMAVEPGLRRQWLLLVTQIPIIGGILGLFSFVVMLPYAVLAAKNSFFRKRLFAYANLNPSIAAETAAVTPEMRESTNWRNT